MTNTKQRRTIAIDEPGDSITVSLDGRTMLAVAIRGDGAADYRIDGREVKTGDWFEGVLPNLTGSSDYTETLETAWNQVRIQCVNGTGTTDDTAEVGLSAARK